MRKGQCVEVCLSFIAMGVSVAAGVVLLILAAVAAAAPPVPISRTAAKIEAGRELFFERAISIDFSTSCGGCHKPERAYTDGRRVAVGLIGNQNAPNGFLGTINTPTVLGAIFKKEQFSDGRGASIADQSLQPWTNPAEMGLASINQGLNRLANVPDFDGGPKYRRLMGLAYGSPEINADRCADCFAHFEATLTVADAPYQLFIAGNNEALTERQKAGFEVFKRSGCMECHQGRELRDGKFNNNGYALRASVASGRIEIGRQRQTGNPRDRGAIATPTLINVGDTGPYMHDGSLASLAEVVAHYNSGGQFIRPNAPNAPPVADRLKDPRVKRLDLSPRDFWDLVWFLDTATRGTIPYVPDSGQRAR